MFEFIMLYVNVKKFSFLKTRSTVSDFQVSQGKALKTGLRVWRAVRYYNTMRLKEL